MDNINKNLITNFKKASQQKYSVAQYVNNITQGNITVLSKAITLIESTLEKDKIIAQQIIEKCLPFSGNSYRIGITGVPGVGKSTFIETFGLNILKENRKLAVLAIDPTSEQSKGSILGDKTRMEELSSHKNAFIRPSPTSGTLGGVAEKTREIIILCEAAGFNTILIETVGVGQSEIEVNSMVDVFILLMLAGAGDELQGIKRGIMEMADILVITKADSNNVQNAKNAKIQYENALHLFPAKKSDWITKVLTASAYKNKGITEIWKTINNFFDTVKQNNYFEQNRKQQIKKWLHEAILNKLKSDFYNNQNRKKTIKKFEEKAVKGLISPFNAVNEIMK